MNIDKKKVAQLNRDASRGRQKRVELGAGEVWYWENGDFDSQKVLVSNANGQEKTVSMSKIKGFMTEGVKMRRSELRQMIREEVSSARRRLAEAKDPMDVLDKAYTLYLKLDPLVYDIERAIANPPKDMDPYEVKELKRAHAKIVKGLVQMGRGFEEAGIG